MISCASMSQEEQATSLKLFLKKQISYDKNLLEEPLYRTLADALNIYPDISSDSELSSVKLESTDNDCGALC